MVKNPPATAGDVGSIPGWRRSPGEGNGNPVQYSFFLNYLFIFGCTRSLLLWRLFLVAVSRGYSS